MSNLVIYDQKKQDLSEVSFLKDTSSQIKISEIKDSVQIINQMSSWIADTSLIMKIKDAIPLHQKKDIKEMILLRFKNLSFDELYYAFKMERYGVLRLQIEHYQIFDAAYVGKILDKYVDWKREVKTINSISNKTEPEEMSEEQKIYWKNRGVLTCLDIYKETKKIPANYIYVYDILYEDYLPKDVEYKKKVYEDAKTVLQMEYSEKEATTREENKYIKKVLKNLNDKSSPKVKTKSKELVLCEFFRNMLKNEKSANEFNEKFKY